MSPSSQGTHAPWASRESTLPVGVTVLKMDPCEFLISDYYTAGSPNAKIN